MLQVGALGSGREKTAPPKIKQRLLASELVPCPPGKCQILQGVPAQGTQGCQFCGPGADKDSGPCEQGPKGQRQPLLGREDAETGRSGTAVSSLLGEDFAGVT